MPFPQDGDRRGAEFISDGQSRDKLEFPHSTVARELNAVIQQLLREPLAQNFEEFFEDFVLSQGGRHRLPLAGFGRVRPREIFLSAERIGATCSPPIEAAATARLAALRLWARFLARRGKRTTANAATSHFAAVWNDTCAHRYGFKLSRSRLFAWRAAYTARGLGGLIDGRSVAGRSVAYGERRRFKAIPRTLWCNFCRHYLTPASPKPATAWRQALDECPAGHRAALAAEYPATLFAARVRLIPEIVAEFARHTRDDSDLAARSPQVSRFHRLTGYREIYLPAEKLGALCSPPMEGVAIAFRAAMDGWRSRPRRISATRSKPIYALSDAIRSLGRRLAGPLAGAAVDLYAAPQLQCFWRHLQGKWESFSNRARIRATARLGALRLWARFLARRGKRTTAIAATSHLAAVWNDTCAHRYGFKISRSRLFAWQAAYTARGVDGLIDGRSVAYGERRRFKAIPGTLWRNFCRHYFTPACSNATAWHQALDECPAEHRAALAAEYPATLFAARVRLIPEIVAESFARHTRDDSDLAARSPLTALARSPFLLPVLALAFEPEGQP